MQPSPEFLKPFLILSFAFFAVTGCDDGQKNITDDGTINATTLADTCRCDELVADSITNTWSLNNVPYTGVCIRYYESSKDKYLEQNLLEGKLHGKVTYFDRSGEILFEEMFDKGEQKRAGNSGDGLTCGCNELEFVKTADPQYPTIARLDEIPFTGKCEEKYRDSEQRSMESNYKNGVLDGYTIYYNRDGSSILIEHYDMGELVSVVN